MKVKVNRVLSSGLYHVNFEVGEFTPDELNKMERFGIPAISMQWERAGNRVSGSVSINQINKSRDAIFSTEVEAKKYEEAVLSEMREAMRRVRESQDKFSSSEEVAL